MIIFIIYIYHCVLYLDYNFVELITLAILYSYIPLLGFWIIFSDNSLIILWEQFL